MFAADAVVGQEPTLLFTDNTTNPSVYREEGGESRGQGVKQGKGRRGRGAAKVRTFYKDAFHKYIVNGKLTNANEGTWVFCRYRKWAIYCIIYCIMYCI